MLIVLQSWQCGEHHQRCEGMGIDRQAYIGALFPIVPNGQRYHAAIVVGIPMIARLSVRGVWLTDRKVANAESTPI